MPKKTRRDYPSNWHEISEQIKKRDNYQCQECKLQFSHETRKVKDVRGKWQTLGVHHKDRRPMNSDPQNLITLCSSCHCKAEWPLIRAEIRDAAIKKMGQLQFNF